MPCAGCRNEHKNISPYSGKLWRRSAEGRSITEQDKLINHACLLTIAAAKDDEPEFADTTGQSFVCRLQHTHHLRARH